MQCSRSRRPLLAIGLHFAGIGLLGVSCRAASAWAAPRELLKNGGFEDGSEIPDGWTIVGFHGSGKASRTTEHAASGKAALRIEVSGTEEVETNKGQKGTNPLKVLQAVEPAPVGEIVTVKARATGTGLDGAATLLARVLLSNGRTLAATHAEWLAADIQSSSFTERTCRLYVPGGAGTLEVSVDLTGHGSVVFDDLSATADAAPTLARGQNALVSPGFEEGRGSWITYQGDAAATFDLVPEAAHSGRTGARIVRNEAGGGRPVLVNWGQQTMGPSFSEKEIEVAAWIRTKDVKGRAILGVYVVGIDLVHPGGKPIQTFVPFFDRAMTGSQPWTRVARRVDLKGISVHEAWIRVGLEGTGTVDLDDAFLGLIPPELPWWRSPFVFVPVVALAIALAALAIGRRTRRPGAER